MAISNPTPQEVNAQTQKESNENNIIQNVANISQTNPDVINKNIPSTLQPKGASKLAILLNKNRSKIISTFIPILTGLAIKIGIENFGKPNMKLPDTCLPSPELTKITNIRNQLINKLNNLVKVINSLSKVLTGIGLAAGIFTTLIKKIKKSRKKLNKAMLAFPGGSSGLPGALPASSNVLKDVEDTLTPKLQQASAAVTSIGLSLSLINSALLKVITLLKPIDAYLNKCSKPELVPLSSTLLEIERINTEIEQDEQQNEQTYQGFILEIIEEPYSPTVNRRKAIAKNKDGIILLQTPLSFTTLPQILIAEIKLIIDSNDLKAN